MNKAQFALTAHAIALIAAMAFAVPALTEALGGKTGFLVSLLLYWLGFCLPVIAFHIWPDCGDLFSERLRWRDWWLPLVLLAQVFAVALIVFVPHTAMLTTQAAMLAGLVGLINAPMEETAWRGGFMRVFAERPRLGFALGWALFTAAHIPLLLGTTLVIDGGWPLLVGSAAALGLLWSWIAWRTGSVFWTIIAHTLTDIIVIWHVFDRNGLA